MVRLTGYRLASRATWAAMQKEGILAYDLRVREGDVVYELLGTGGRVGDEEYQALIREWMPPRFAGRVTMEILD